ncbi:putative phosphatidate phosphatase [Papilio machaon]|uniref:putative phosphatidate phosphatase n=1 Tax=Papilio machaon TaxID=76193 RepID=UPI001E665078|nr:putative phosphatidate phosphatase [Papilio machaon]
MSREEVTMLVLRKIVVDAFMFGALALSIYFTRYLWLPFERGFFCGDESLMFPYKDDTVSTTVLRAVGLGLPIVIFLICEWVLLRKDYEDQRCLGLRVPSWLRGFYCALVSFGLGTCFVELSTNIAKNVIGRPRPHFFDLCKPSVDCGIERWRGRYIQADEYTCTGTLTDKFTDMHMSFLSGHSAWSAYTMIYLALYLEKRMVWRGTRVLRHSLQFVVVMLSWFTALSRVSDYKHHWSDVLAGYFLGVTLAVLVWTWGTDIVPQKKKHSPLPQHDFSMAIHPHAAAPA